MADDNGLDAIRQHIDEVDRKLIDLISERATLAARIAELKKWVSVKTCIM